MAGGDGTREEHPQPLDVARAGTAEDSTARVLYVLSPELTALSGRGPVNQDRSALVHSLVAATGLLGLKGVTVAQSEPASFEELTEFHSAQYIRALQRWESLPEEELAQFGLEYDCLPFPGIARMCALLAGATLRAADALVQGGRVSIAWDGGRHHARKASASGYCYVNDAVLAIFRLLDAFERVMYIDIDIHHGDGVQDAFYLTNKVLTLSMHKWGRGFFPGGGALHDVGVGAGRGFSLNLPLKDGLRDATFISAFEALASSTFRQFQPTAVVMQCGADGLAGDPLGDGFGLTPKAIAACVGRAVSWGAPLLLLGGGGYNSPAVARTWTAATAAALGVSLPDDIPEHQYFPPQAHGPDFRLFSLPCPSLRPDLNDREEVLEDCEWLLAQLRTALAEKQYSSG